MAEAKEDLDQRAYEVLEREFQEVRGGRARLAMSKATGTLQRGCRAGGLAAAAPG
jgi:hypothetical protein